MIKTTQALLFTGLSAVLTMPSDVVRAEWLADMSLSTHYDSNINRASFINQQLEDYVTQTLLSAGRAFQLSDSSRLYLTANWQSETYYNFNNLDQHTIGGKMVLAHKLGLGSQVPVLSLNLSGGEIFSESQLRSGEQVTTGLRLSKWCNEVFQVYIGYQFDDRTSSTYFRQLRQFPNNVYDLQGHSLELGNNWVLSEKMQLSMNYVQRWGGVISNGNNYGSSSGYWQRVNAVSRDDVFSGWTYRAEGNTLLMNVGLNYALFSGHAAAAVNYSYIASEAVGLVYQSHQVQLSINYSY